MFLLRIFLAVSLITLLLFIFVTFRLTLLPFSLDNMIVWVEEGNVVDCLQRVKETQPTTNSSAVTDTGANTTMSPDPLGSESILVPVMDKHNFTSLVSMKCMASLRNSSNPVFKEKFIPNIQLGTDFITSTTPFGYMGLNYTAKKAAVDTIPKLASTQLLQVPIRAKDGCIRCAVVGDGEIMLCCIHQVNAAIIAGHDEDVGKRTSVYVHTAHSLIQSLLVNKKRGFKQIPTDKDIKYVLIPEAPRDYNFFESLMKKNRKKKNRKIPSGAYRGGTPRNYYNGHFNETSYYFLHPDFLRYPTNGAFTLLLAMDICDIVRAYGFSTADYQKYPNYYYDNKNTKLVCYANHDYRLEMRTWKKFHDDKFIWTYLGKSDNLNKSHHL
uniref:alpha-N-acetylgalactosaminide alpha-2,6-sialyltransferase n=1 Tax=Cyprinus carpio TaxID=7962 RepID=A0A8C1Q446_CYPCA